MIDIAGWAPEPQETTEVIDAAPSAALAGVLGVEPPGDELPPLWQWVHFLERPAQRELGPDGHPRDGRFLPPVPERRRMFAGGRFRVREPLRVGDTVTRRTELASTVVKQGRSGEMLFVTVRHGFLRDGAEIAVEEQDLVYRSGDAAASPGEVSFSGPDVKAPWTLALTADPVLLFRFGALTYNAHRIHYDEAYATGVEGHGGLVVHGPLLAILCLELPRRAGRTVRELSFRARRPVYAGQPFVAAGSPDGELSIEAPGGVTAMTATFA
ncbi:MaoC family dehydratase N-terminal domain-containing protein [Actinomadura sp. NAK00032]|uniref:FAS1-like dehydratase domain-containing protein n=1 Tax=Actinomadura sp. NAK00032 TaxID=2742128 RepID=UPI00159276C9|nr:MaoC family dehydratase N-terminal domain-containing protein [Actinomadura sp. NAK00032]QKW35671.1 MaoC family dehydratase N-terminal domain-containing protein [Actinomadura sp. NAK00032]